MALVTYLVWTVVAIILYFVLSIILKYQKHSKYLKKNGIPYLGMGLNRAVKFFTNSTNFVVMETEIYKECKETKAPIVGLSDVFGELDLYIMDLELVKNIYVKDFDHFINRRSFGSPKWAKYLVRMLFAMEGEPWKGLRTKLSPTFTTSKIRRMFGIFKKSSERMETYIKEQMMTQGYKSIDLNFSQVFPKYAMDVIASCAFGIDSKSFEVPPDKKAIFEQMGSQLQFGLKFMIKFLIAAIFPKLMGLLGSDVMDAEACEYFAGVTKDVMKRRRQTGERREDFLQLMMDLQQGLLKEDEEANQVMNGSAEGEGTTLSSSEKGKVTFDDEDIVANAMIFMLAGFDTTQSVLLFTMYCLALEPEVQQKLFEEVEFVKGKHGGELTYDTILDMTYLDMVINECMRVYPPSVKTERMCTQDYPVPGTNVVIKKGTIIDMPIHQYHLDARYFPDPTKFVPERFSVEGKANRNPYVFMPFGHGPRNCIGMRFALVMVKTVIAHLVSKFKLAPCGSTLIPMEYENTTSLKPKGGMQIGVTARE